MATLTDYATRWCPKRGKSSDHDCTREAGSRDKAQRKVYALEVAIALTGKAICVHCSKAISLVEGEGDVDRVIPGSCYLPGSIILICRSCNNRMANASRDMKVDIDFTRYADDVRKASDKVTVKSPTVCLAIVREANAISGLENSPYAR